jgi:transcriptional regulator with XRE-family HTH domain
VYDYHNQLKEDSLSISPFGAYLREVRAASGKSLREVADALGISHVYLGEVERGRRRTLPKKYWESLVEVVPAFSRAELESLAGASEPLNPAAMEGRSREVVVALARKLEEGAMTDDLANRLLKILQQRESRRL